MGRDFCPQISQMTQILDAGCYWPPGPIRSTWPLPNALSAGIPMLRVAGGFFGKSCINLNNSVQRLRHREAGGSFMQKALAWKAAYPVLRVERVGWLTDEGFARRGWGSGVSGK